MMGRVGDRVRASWTGLLRGELEGVRAELTTSWTSSFDELRRDVVAERADVDARVAEHDSELVNALHRVAEAFEGIATSLDTDRRDRRDQLDAVEFLLRELVIGFAQPTALRPVVLGGTIAPGALDPDANRSEPAGAIDIDLSDAPIPVDTFVEVRSRFHDHWVHGFAVAKYIPGPTRRGYRLRRLTDTEQLPLLFDAADVRRATAPTDHPAGDLTEEPEPSMWR
jgi:hypothetical protein